MNKLIFPCKLRNQAKVFAIFAIIISVLFGGNISVLSQQNPEPKSPETNSSTSEPNRGLQDSDSEENLTDPSLQPEVRQNSSTSSNDNPFAPTVVQGTARRSSPSNVAKTLTDLNQFQTLASILQLVDLDQELQKQGFLVIFAPTETAFDQLSNYNLLILPENREQLLQFLKSHLVMREIPMSELEDGKIQTLAGTQILITINSETQEILLNESSTIQTEFIQAQNGLIVPIDKILVKPQM